MSNSLRDQLVKAGLATSAQAKQVERQQAAAKRKKKGGKKGGAQGAKSEGAKNERIDDPAVVAKARARQQRAEKASRDKALAKARNEKASERAKRAEIKQLIAAHDQRPKAASDDDVAYNFVHGKKIKRLYLPQPLVDALSAGRLAIVNNDGRYNLVSNDVADKIRARDPKWIVAVPGAKDGADASASEDDAYYEQFKVPDDLDW
ncbi:MAG: DUF2058 family protein [Pseudomonadota bacterium]